MTLTGHDSWVRGLLFHPSGRFLLSCSDDKTIRAWDLTKQGRCVRRLEAAHETFVTALDFASGKAAQALASVGADSTLRIWECV